MVPGGCRRSARRCGAAGPSGRRASESATAATSVRLWPASASRPVGVRRPRRPTTWPTTSATLTARAATSAGRPSCGSPAPGVTPLGVRPPPRPGRRRPVAPADLGRQVGLDQRQVVGVGHARCTGRRWAAPGTPSRRGHVRGPAPRPASADHLGQQHLGVLRGVAAAAMAPPETPRASRGRTPRGSSRRARRRRARRARGRPWPRSARRRPGITWRRSSTGQPGPSASTSHTPRVTGESPDHGVAGAGRPPGRRPAPGSARCAASSDRPSAP